MTRYLMCEECGKVSPDDPGIEDEPCPDCGAEAWATLRIPATKESWIKVKGKG